MKCNTCVRFIDDECKNSTAIAEGLADDPARCGYYVGPPIIVGEDDHQADADDPGDLWGDEEDEAQTD